MDAQIKIDFKNMVRLVNNYITSKESSNIEEIEKIFTKLFDVAFAKLWKYNLHDEALLLLSGNLKYNVDTSLVKQSINSKSIVICNHLTSDKYYQAQIDNPLSLKVKSLMIFPILKGKNILGILTLYRGLKQKKVFTKNDESLLEVFSTVLLALFESNEITKEKFLELTKKLPVSKEDKKVVTQEKSKQPLPKEKIVKPVLKVVTSKKDTIDWESKYKVLESSLQKVKEVDEKLKLMLEKEKEYTDTIENQALEIQNYRRNDEINRIKIQSFEAEVIALNREYQLLIKTTKLSIQEVQKEKYTLKSEKDFLLDKVNDLKVKFIQEDDGNLEKKFKSFNPLFFEREAAYLFFSIMTYAISSPQGMTYFNEQLQKEKFLKNLINNYSFFMVNNIEIESKTFIKMIESYEKDVFLRKISFNVMIKEGIPQKLIFDVHKVGNAVLLVLNSFYKFIKPHEKLDIHFSFKDALFKIHIGIIIEQKDSFILIKTQDKMVDELENLLCFKLSKKLITRLRGTFDIKYRQDYYIISLDIPIKV